MNKKKAVLVCSVIIIVATVYIVFQPRKLVAYVDYSLHRSNWDQGPDFTLSMRQNFQKLRQPVAHVEYALSLSYWDQISCASGRVLSHQCWAAKMASTIVEPFVIDTSYLGGMNAGNGTKLRDLFDLNNWNQLSIENGLPPLISWEDFLQTAPRQVILVRNNWRQLFRNEPFRCEEQDFKKLKRFWMQFLKAHDFEIFRKVCVDLTNPSELTKIIVDQNSDINVTVVIDDWRKTIGITGISLPYLVKSSSCVKRFGRRDNHEEGVNLEWLKPSLKAMNDADVYISKYLNTDRKYIAVMVRWEKIDRKPTYDFKQCLVKILERVKEMQQLNNVSLVFIATDAGSLGSDLMGRVTRYSMVDIKVRTEARQYTEELLHSVHKPPISLQDYEKQFMEVVQVKNPAYVATVQKVIAAKAECLLRIPALGNYQAHSLMMYKELHSGIQCTKDIHRCSTPAKAWFDWF